MATPEHEQVDPSTNGGDGFSAAKLYRGGEAVAPGSVAPEAITPPSPKDFAEANALKKYQDNQQFAGAGDALAADMRQSRAEKDAAAARDAIDAINNPNIISEMPDFTKPQS